jgi:hypothetical protein
MNKRLKELAKVAGCSVDGMGYGEGNIEGLAELIIKDCILAVNSADDSGENYWGNIIKEHFGVER